MKSHPIEYKGYSTSNLKSIIKDIDEKQGIITGYSSVFGNIDSDGDMMMPGAFKKTLKENIGRIKHLNQHNPLQPLSRPTILKEDAYGLYFESQISQTSYGKDVIRLYVDGVVDEHSIGFNTTREQKAAGHNEIIEVKLWELSTVTWGANEMARATGIKSMTKDQLFTKMDSVVKALRNGSYENEEIFDILELYFKQLQQHIYDLSHAADEAPETVHAAEEAPVQQKEEDVYFVEAAIATTLFKLKSI